jgi:hypothetical protein
VPKIVHLGKPSPSAVLALGEDLTPSVLSVFFWKTSSSSATLGEEIFYSFNPLPRVQHLGKNFLFFLNPLT